MKIRPILLALAGTTFLAAGSQQMANDVTAVQGAMAAIYMYYGNKSIWVERITKIEFVSEGCYRMTAAVVANAQQRQAHPVRYAVLKDDVWETQDRAPAAK